MSPPIVAEYSIVGSRETPDEMLTRLRTSAKILCDLGYRGRSGLAPGVDLAGYEGAQLSDRFEEVGFDNFLPNKWLFKKPEFGGWVPDPSKNIYDVQTFSNYEQATQIAYDARGGFHGLGRGGIELHCRNPYQVLGKDLDKPSRFVLCYAIPIGAKTLEDKTRVKGGTNTAVQVAHLYNVPIINLWWSQNVERIDRFIARHT